MYGRDLKYKDVQNLINALNQSGERMLADEIARLDHFTTVTDFIRRHLG
jgi:hypothetical protein